MRGGEEKFIYGAKVLLPAAKRALLAVTDKDILGTCEYAERSLVNSIHHPLLLVVFLLFLESAYRSQTERRNFLCHQTCKSKVT